MTPALGGSKGLVSARPRGFLLASASGGGKGDFGAGAEPSVQG